VSHASDMDFFFAPRSVAVLGASNKPGKMGHRFMHHLATGYTGPIYPVHPTEQDILGRRVCHDLATIPKPIDLLIALVPADDLLPALRACPRDWFKFLLAIPSGFGEVSSEGKRLQEELVHEARQRGMRLVGPNSLGMFNTCIGLNASMVPRLPRPDSGLSCVTQSGGFGMALSIYANDHQLSVVAFCDLGNMADVDVADVLRYYREDSATTIVGLFLEAGGRTGALAEEIAKLALAKPVVAAWVGRTMEGSRASLAHLGVGNSAGETRQQIAPWCYLAETGLELLNVSKALTWQPIPRGCRAGILTASGGIGAELADLAVEHGLAVPEFTRALQLELKAHLPDYAACGNPVDLTPIWQDYPRLYPILLQTLLYSDEIDLVIVTVIDVATGNSDLIETLRTLAQDESLAAAGKPIYVYWNSARADLRNMARLQEVHWPCYQSSLEVVRVAGIITRHLGFRSRLISEN